MPNAIKWKLTAVGLGRLYTASVKASGNQCAYVKSASPQSSARLCARLATWRSCQQRCFSRWPPRSASGAAREVHRPSLDHLVGKQKNISGNSQTKRVGGLEVNDEF